MQHRLKITIIDFHPTTDQDGWEVDYLLSWDKRERRIFIKRSELEQWAYYNKLSPEGSDIQQDGLISDQTFVSFMEDLLSGDLDWMRFTVSDPGCAFDQIAHDFFEN